MQAFNELLFLAFFVGLGGRVVADLVLGLLDLAQTQLGILSLQFMPDIRERLIPQVRQLLLQKSDCVILDNNVLLHPVEFFLHIR